MFDGMSERLGAGNLNRDGLSLERLQRTKLGYGNRDRFDSSVSGAWESLEVDMAGVTDSWLELGFSHSGSYTRTN